MSRPRRRPPRGRRRRRSRRTSTSCRAVAACYRLQRRGSLSSLAALHTWLGGFSHQARRRKQLVDDQLPRKIAGALVEPLPRSAAATAAPASSPPAASRRNPALPRRRRVVVGRLGLGVAVLLICFCVVHAAGNLAAFGGPETLNAYGHKLHAAGWLLTFVEAYLALALGAHIASASLTLKHGNADPRKSSWAGRGWRRAAPSSRSSCCTLRTCASGRGIRRRSLMAPSRAICGAAGRAACVAADGCVVLQCFRCPLLPPFWGWPWTARKPTGLAGNREGRRTPPPSRSAMRWPSSHRCLHRRPHLHTPGAERERVASHLSRIRK